MGSTQYHHDDVSDKILIDTIKAISRQSLVIFNQYILSHKHASVVI